MFAYWFHTHIALYFSVVVDELIAFSFEKIQSVCYSWWCSHQALYDSWSYMDSGIPTLWILLNKQTCTTKTVGISFSRCTKNRTESWSQNHNSNWTMCLVNHYTPSCHVNLMTTITIKRYGERADRLKNSSAIAHFSSLFWLYFSWGGKNMILWFVCNCKKNAALCKNTCITIQASNYSSKQLVFSL